MLNIFFHNFNNGLNGTTVEFTFAAWFGFNRLAPAFMTTDTTQLYSARFFKV